MTDTPTQTYGEKLVSLSFNPSGDNKVDVIKLLYAEVIDLLHNARSSERENSEYQRYISIAITEAQTAQMRAVKAVTA